MTDRRIQLAGVPLRLVLGDPAPVAAARGTILVYHGFGADIAGQTRELRSLAAAGFLAVGVDAVGHGMRRYADFESRFGPGEGRADDPFFEVVRASAAEIPALIDALLESDLAKADRIGIAGISMGGYIAYAAPVVERRITALTPVLASPEWPEGVADSPHLHLDRFPPIAILSQNAELDENVPPACARRFHERLTPLYAAHRERLHYLEFAGCRHFMPEDAWDRLWRNVLEWHVRHMGSARE